MDLLEQHKQQKEKKRLFNQSLEIIIDGKDLTYMPIDERTKYLSQLLENNDLKWNEIHLIMALQDLEVKKKLLIKMPLSNKDKNNKRISLDLNKLKNRIKEIKKCNKKGKMYFPNFIINKKNQCVKVKN